MMNAPTSLQSPVNAPRRAALRRIVGGAAWVAAASSLTACGFKLRGVFTFGFSALQVTGQVNSPVSKALQENISKLGVIVGGGAPVAGPGGTVVLNVVTDQRERAVAGGSTSGQVRELVLRQRFRYSLSTPAGKRLLEETEMVLERNISYNESDALSKSAEEQLLYADMQSDTVQQVLRRLSAVKAV